MSSHFITGIVPLTKRYLCLLIIAFLAVQTPLLSGKDVTKAHTVDGRGVLLREDGTWEYSGGVGFFDVERIGVESIDDISIADLLPGTVVAVTDGDTIRVIFADPPPGVQPDESVRLLGIDTPELQTPSGPDPLAEEAREFVIQRTADPAVYLAFESKWRGSFGRLLAYVFTNDGRLLNGELLSHGLASVYHETPCYFHQEFVSLEVAARLEAIGMWTTQMSGDVVIRQVFNEGRTEYVELWNRSDRTVDLSGWYLSDEQENRIDIPTHTSISRNERFYVLSGAGTTPPSPNFVHPTYANIWNNSGDTARLLNRDDEVVTEYSY